MAVTKLPYKDFEEYMGGGGYPYGPAFYNENNPGRFDDEFPNPFGEDLFDRVKANPRRGSSAGKKDAFQNLLNNATGQQIAQMGVAGPANVIPSQMPNAMGGMPTHGITQNLAPIPGTAMGNMGGVVTDFGKGVEAIKEAKDKGGLMNPETRRMLEMLQGY
tara:strand:+ start:52 stop:534 length:483 start_codon:yes stop_codon:yes gene_type:complete